MAGTNGEADSLATREEFDRRLQTAPDVETIGDQTFSLWKVDGPLQTSHPRFSPKFVVLVLVGSISLLGAGRWAVDRIASGDFLVGQIFAVAIMALMFLGPAILIAFSKRSHKMNGPAQAPPDGIPSKAIVALVAIPSRGRSVGWLWFEGDVMHFRGFGFDFRLHREDFTMKVPILRAWRGGEGARMRRPAGISSYNLMLFPGNLCGDSFARDPRCWKELQNDIKTWESGTCSIGPSLFPPIRPVPSVRPANTWQRLVIPPLFMAILLGSAGLLLPLNRDNALSPPIFLAAVGLGFGLLWNLIVWMSFRTTDIANREADKASRR